MKLTQNLKNYLLAAVKYYGAQELFSPRGTLQYVIENPNKSLRISVFVLYDVVTIFINNAVITHTLHTPIGKFDKTDDWFGRLLSQCEKHETVQMNEAHKKYELELIAYTNLSKAEQVQNQIKTL